MRGDRQPPRRTGTDRSRRASATAPAVLARDTRIRLAAEHLGRAPDDVDDLVDPASWFEALRKGADALDAWHRVGAAGERPPGHLREHPIERVRGDPALGPRPRRTPCCSIPTAAPVDLRRRNEF